MTSDTSILNFPLETISRSLPHFYPEVALVFFFITIIVADLFIPLKSKNHLWWLAVIGLAVVGFAAFLQPAAAPPIFFEALNFTSSTKFLKLYFILSTVLVLIYLRLKGNEAPDYSRKGEFYAFIFALLLGLNVMVMSNNLLLVYLGIELVSISFYVLVAINRKPESAEAGLKYLLFGAVTSALMLYGISWYYGLTGTLQWTTLPSAHSSIVCIILLLLSAGTLFKLSLFPFHIWTPDIYEGAPTPIVALLSVVPKAAGIAVLSNILQHLFPISGGLLIENNWILKGFVIILVASITIGNFSALAQRNMKRMLAYSSIAHAGFLAIALLHPSLVLNEVALIYLSIYLLMNLAAFLLADYLETATGSTKMEDYKGIGLKYPFLGLLIVILMISLTGLPPTAGFYAKFLIFAQLYKSYQQYNDTWLLILLIFGLLNTVISLFYYLKIPYYLFFKTKESAVFVENKSSFYYYFSILIMPLILLFFMPDLLTNLINFISR